MPKKTSRAKNSLKETTLQKIVFRLNCVDQDTAQKRYGLRPIDRRALSLVLLPTFQSNQQKQLGEDEYLYNYRQNTNIFIVILKKLYSDFKLRKIFNNNHKFSTKYKI